MILEVFPVKQQQPDIKHVGLLASSATHKIKLFEPLFEQAGLILHYPDDTTQDVVMQVIRSVKAGSLTDRIVDDYNNQLATLSNQGAECLLLGCSELSVLYHQTKGTLPVVDSLQVLADAIVLEA